MFHFLRSIVAYIYRRESLRRRYEALRNSWPFRLIFDFALFCFKIENWVLKRYRFLKAGIYLLDSYSEIEKDTHFRKSTRPVIRWIKGDGLDDEITRSAIAQATRLFGSEVDYCLCTNDISAERVRNILAWAVQPVEWFPVTPRENQRLAQKLNEAGCDRDHFGYWWKWFPERVRPCAPEWILDGDMVITARPKWFEEWKAGRDLIRVAQSNKAALHTFGEYADLVDKNLMLYSGFVSLPPNQFYLDEFLRILAERPLKKPHDGCRNMSEQGVVATAFSNLKATPIPLYEFPFAISGFETIDYGVEGPIGSVWGYHFGCSFVRKNEFFERFIREGVVFSLKDAQSLVDRFAWLRNNSQWGREGYSMNPVCADRILSIAKGYVGEPILEIGTSRGYLSAILASVPCKLTTIDRKNRGASNNLNGMGVEVVKADALQFLNSNKRKFKMITADLHGNEDEVWAALWKFLPEALDKNGTIVLYNSHLWDGPDFPDQTGIRWLQENGKLSGFNLEIFPDPPPGMIVCKARPSESIE